MTQLSTDPANLLAVANAYLNYFARETIHHLQDPQLGLRVAEALGTVGGRASAPPVAPVPSVVPVLRDPRVADFASCAT